jgi:hypothetical protein
MNKKTSSDNASIKLRVGKYWGVSFALIGAVSLAASSDNFVSWGISGSSIRDTGDSDVQWGISGSSIRDSGDSDVRWGISGSSIRGTGGGDVQWGISGSSIRSLGDSTVSWGISGSSIRGTGGGDVQWGISGSSIRSLGDSTVSWGISGSSIRSADSDSGVSASALLIGQVSSVDQISGTLTIGDVVVYSDGASVYGSLGVGSTVVISGIQPNTEEFFLAESITAISAEADARPTSNLMANY